VLSFPTCNYRRAFIPGGCFFFTVNLLERRQTLLVDEIAVLREARMKTSRAQLDRLLDPENESVTLGTLARAAQAIGRHLRMELV
jgi:antitoxin HicB